MHCSILGLSLLCHTGRESPTCELKSDGKSTLVMGKELLLLCPLSERSKVAICSQEPQLLVGCCPFPSAWHLNRKMDFVKCLFPCCDWWRPSGLTGEWGEHEYQYKKRSLPRKENTDQKNIGEEGGPGEQLCFARPAHPGPWGPIFPACIQQLNRAPTLHPQHQRGARPPLSLWHAAAPGPSAPSPPGDKPLADTRWRAVCAVTRGARDRERIHGSGPSPPHSPGSPPHLSRGPTDTAWRGNRKREIPRAHITHTHGRLSGDAERAHDVPRQDRPANPARSRDQLQPQPPAPPAALPAQATGRRRAEQPPMGSRKFASFAKPSGKTSHPKEFR